MLGSGPPAPRYILQCRVPFLGKNATRQDVYEKKYLALHRCIFFPRLSKKKPPTLLNQAVSMPGAHQCLDFILHQRCGGIDRGQDLFSLLVCGT